jgi:hypothetical protein
VTCIALLAAPQSIAGDKTGFDSGAPAVTSKMKVSSLRTRGPYLEAQLSLEGTNLQAYTLPGGDCEQVLQPDTEIEYLDSGPMGVYKKGDLRCQQMGVGNLILWRDRNRRAASAPVLRQQANFKTLYTDDEITMLRGRFPLASAVGFTGALDIVVVVGDSKECEGPIESGVASMEYRGKGKRPLTLVGKSGLCLIQALIQPPPQGRPSTTAAPEIK